MTTEEKRIDPYELAAELEKDIGIDGVKADVIMLNKGKEQVPIIEVRLKVNCGHSLAPHECWERTPLIASMIRKRFAGQLRLFADKLDRTES